MIALFAIWAVSETVSQKKAFGPKFKTNSFIMSDTVGCNASINDLYHFFIHHYDEIYPKTAKIHKEFTLLNSDSITVGTRILCKEGEEKEMISHQYIVHEVIPNRLIYKSSEPSIIQTSTKRGPAERESNVFVYVEFFEVSEVRSRVAFTIITQMPNYFFKLAGRILGGKKAKEEWESHLYEELDGFVEQYYAF